MRKSNNKHIVDEQEIMRFNLRRENEKGKSYSSKEFKELLKRMGYCQSGSFVKSMISGENPPFIRVERGKYTFNPNPVHISRLQKAWDEYSRINATSVLNAHISIEQAVKVLKDAGYKVLKPITQYEEI